MTWGDAKHLYDNTIISSVVNIQTRSLQIYFVVLAQKSTALLCVQPLSAVSGVTL